MTKANKKSNFMSIRMDEKLREHIKKKANENQRSLSGQILYYIYLSVKQELENVAN